MCKRVEEGPHVTALTGTSPQRQFVTSGKWGKAITSCGQMPCQPPTAGFGRSGLYPFVKIALSQRCIWHTWHTWLTPFAKSLLPILRFTYPHILLFPFIFNLLLALFCYFDMDLKLQKSSSENKCKILLNFLIYKFWY